MIYDRLHPSGGDLPTAIMQMADRIGSASVDAVLAWGTDSYHLYAARRERRYQALRRLVSALDQRTAVRP